MNNNLIELAKLIFDDKPKDPFSIQMELDNYDSIESLFEVLLHIFIYGYKIKKLDVSTIHTLKDYFKAIGVNFNIEIIPYSEYEFLTNPKYLTRYCNISSQCFNNYDLDDLGFILSRNYKSLESIDKLNSCYIHEIPNDFNQSFISFISFNYKIDF
jgi:ABC-type transport system substrate-binding protein